MAKPAFSQMPPQIILQPRDQYACIGNDVTFFVQAFGSQPMDFYWFENSSPVTSGVVSTPTNSFLTVTNVQLSDNGSDFYVIVSNQFNIDTSSNAFLFVSDVPRITQQPLDVSVPLGGTITFTVNAGPAPLAYQWWFQGAPMTNSPQVSGVTTPNLTILNAQLTNAGYYRVVITNSCLLINSISARCEVGNPPHITNQPVNLVAPFQATVQFNVGASEPPPLFYQWFRNDVPIPFANNPVLPLPNVQRQQVGIYHVVVANNFGATVSDRVHLQVELTYEDSIIPRQEATDVIDSLTNALRTWSPPPTVIFHGVPLLFSTYDATADSWETNRCGVPPSHSMWVLYFSPRAEPTKVSTEGSDFATVLAVYTWDGDPSHYPVQIACDKNSGYDGRTSLLTLNAQAQMDYYIAVDGVGGATGNVRLQVGEIIRKAAYDSTNRTFHFEMAGPYWFALTLKSSTNLTQPATNWPTLLTIPATNHDYVARYTNYTPWADAARFYRTAVNTNSTP